MTLVSIAGKNVRRQIGNYIAFLVSNAFSTMVFFLFISLYYTKEIAEKLDVSTSFLGLFQLSAVLICVFALIFLWYSSALFLRQRKQQLGTYLLVGMRQSQLAGMVVVEHLILGFVATLAGVVVGIVFLRLFSMFLLALMRYHVEVYAKIGLRAILTSTGVFMVLHLFAGLSSATTVFRLRLIDLIRAKRKVEPKPRARWLLIIIAIAGIGAGYVMAFRMYPDSFRLFGILTILIITILGTFALFGGAFAGILAYLKRKSIRRNDGVGILSNGELSFRVRKNAKLLATVAVFNAVSITAAGTVFSFYTDMQEVRSQIELRSPHSFSFIIESPEEGRLLTTAAAATFADEPLVQGVVEIVIPEEDLPVSGNVTVDAIIGESDLAALGVTYTPADSAHGALFVTESHSMVSPEDLRNTSVGQMVHIPTLPRSETITIEDARIAALLPSSFIHGLVLLAVSDDLFASVLEASADSEFIAFMDYEKPARTGSVYDYLAQRIPEGELVSYIYFYRGMMGNLGLLLFAGTFIGVTLILANGSILYFRQLMEATDSADRYRLAAYIGFTRRQITDSIRRQLAVVFSLPFVVGLSHAMFALKLLENLTSVHVWSAHIVVVVSYIVLYLFFFLANNRAYSKIIGIGDGGGLYV